MKHIYILLAFLITFSVQSQRNPESTYMSTFAYKAKDGMVDKFEKAVAKKTKMFNTEEGSVILTYRVLTGNNSGVYERYLINQKSSSYDMDRSDELDYWDKNVAPYGDPVGGQQRWLLIEGLNIGEGGAPSKYLQKRILVMKPGEETHVYKYLWRQGQVIQKRFPNSVRRAFRLISGGDTQVIAIFSAYDSHPRSSDSESSWEEDYNEMFGWEQQEIDSDNMAKSLRDWGGSQRYTLQRVDF